MASDPTQNERRLASWSAPRFQPAPFSPWEGGWRKLSRWALLGVFLVWLTSIFFRGEPGLTFLALLCGVICAAGTAFEAKYGTKQQDNPRLVQEAQSFADSLPDSARGMAVKVYFSVEGNLYGEDVGVLTLTEGWLVFEGCRTDFSLAPHDSKGARVLAPVEYLSRAEVPVAGLETDIRILISATDTKDSLAGLLYDWTAAEVALPAISVLPPLEVAPRTTDDRRLRIVRLSNAISGIAVCALMLVATDRWLRQFPPSHVSAFPGVFGGLIGGPLAVLIQSLKKLPKRIGRRAALRRLAACRQQVLDAQPPRTLPDPNSSILTAGIREDHAVQSEVRG